MTGQHVHLWDTACFLRSQHTQNDGKFNVYDDIKSKLISQGIPQKKIAFIHDANTEVQKAELFAKVRRGQVRVLIGSTQKMGAGTNVQDHIVAFHDLDFPWHPADVGRILRTFKIKKKKLSGKTSGNRILCAIWFHTPWQEGRLPGSVFFSRFLYGRL